MMRRFTPNSARFEFGLHEDSDWCLNRKMFTRGVRAVLFIGSVSMFLPSFPVQAQPTPRDPWEEILRKVRLIEEQVKKIETDQQEILSRQEKILAELDSLRVWVARR